MSAFLGSTISTVLNNLESGASKVDFGKSGEIDLDLARIGVIAKDNTDRNRTSPFAFTGNKFEFRALGASQSICYPAAFLNAAVAASLRELNVMLKERLKKDTLENSMLSGPVKWNNLHADVVFSYGGKITALIESLGVRRHKIMEIPTGIDPAWISGTTPARTSSSPPRPPFGSMA
jgi:glutamine synthetase type III